MDSAARLDFVGPVPRDFCNPTRSPALKRFANTGSTKGTRINTIDLGSSCGYAGLVQSKFLLRQLLFTPIPPADEQPAWPQKRQSLPASGFHCQDFGHQH
jgi:hypothetical protein